MCPDRKYAASPGSQSLRFVDTIGEFGWGSGLVEVLLISSALLLSDSTTKSKNYSAAHTIALLLLGISFVLPHLDRDAATSRTE